VNVAGADRSEPDGYSEEMLNFILNSFDDGLTMTLRDLYRRNPKYPWANFMHAVSRLVSEGYLEGKGDGFEVHYGLTPRGRSAAGRAP
jgi:hypothetical protein